MEQRPLAARPRWQVRLVGSFALLDQGIDVTPRGRKACAILAYLLTRDGSHVPRERLAAMLWGDRGPAQARASLRQSLLEIRQAFGDPDGPVQADRGHVWVDDHRIELITFDSGSGDVPLLEDLDHISHEYDEWLAVEREHLRRRIVERECLLIDQALEVGDYPSALDRVEKLEAADPLNEDALRLRMRAEAAAGRSAAVKQAFVAYADLVRRELGVAPTDESRALRDRLIEDLTHDAPPTSPPLADPGPVALPPSIEREEPGAPASPKARQDREAGDDAGLYLAALDPRDDQQTARAESPLTRTPQKFGVAPLLAGLAVVAGIGGLALTLPWSQASGNDLVVAPFETAGIASETAAGFAQDLGEQFAGHRSIRVIGSSALLTDERGALQIEAMRDRLGIDYVLTGSLRRGKSGIEMTARLLRTSDGATVLESSEAASALSPALEQKLVGDVAAALGVQSRARVSAPIAEADYDGYLQALAMIRAREPDGMKSARDMLYRIVGRNPDFAPAWAQIGLVEAIHGDGKKDMDAARQRAREALSRAMRLDPTLPEVHAGLAMLDGQGSLSARRHIAEAVRLDPRDPQLLYWFSAAESSAGQFDRARRAVGLALRFDPNWRRPIEVEAEALAQEGRLDSAMALTSRLDSTQPAAAMGARLMALNAAGRPGEAVAAAYRNLPDALRSGTGMVSLQSAMVMLGMADAATVVGAAPVVRQLMAGAPLTPAIVQSIGAPQLPDWEKAEQLDLVTGRLLEERRYAELLSLFDTVPSMMSGKPVSSLGAGWDLLKYGPDMVIALRATGQAARAEAILRQIEKLSATVAANRYIPNDALVQLAVCQLLSGERAKALDALERASRQGFIAMPGGVGQTLANNPRLAPLRGDPRFDRLAAQGERAWRAQQAIAQRALRDRA